MHTETRSEKNISPGITPPVKPAAAWRVTQVQPLPDYCLQVSFVDGTKGIVNMKALIQSADAGVFSVLADAGLFGQVRVDYGAVTWPHDFGLDLAPDAMYDEIKKNGEWILR